MEEDAFRRRSPANDRCLWQKGLGGQAGRLCSDETRLPELQFCVEGEPSGRDFGCCVEERTWRRAVRAMPANVATGASWAGTRADSRLGCVDDQHSQRLGVCL